MGSRTDGVSCNKRKHMLWNGRHGKRRVPLSVRQRTQPGCVFGRSDDRGGLKGCGRYKKHPRCGGCVLIGLVLYLVLVARRVAALWRN